eukprot:g17204.t1
MPVPVARTYISYVPSYLAGSNGRSYVPPVQGAESRSYVPPAEGAGGPSYAPCEAGKTGTDGWSYTPFVTGGGSYVPPEPGGPSYVPPARGSPSYIPAVAASTGNRSYVPPGPGDTARYTATPVPLRYADVSRRPYGATMTLPSGGSFIQVPEAKLSNRSPSLTPSYTPSIESFVVTAWPGAKTPPEVKGSKKALSLEECGAGWGLVGHPSVSRCWHAALPENQECADCGAPRPDWASVNQGTLICIDCAGTHRSLGAHISKVKSLGLDKWKPDEVENFVSKGGNRKVNESLRKGGAPVAPQLGAPRAAWDIYIRRKYAEKAPLDTRLNGYHPKSLGAAQAGGSPSEGEGLKAVVPERSGFRQHHDWHHFRHSCMSTMCPRLAARSCSAAGFGRSLNLHRELSCHLGTTCHQGLVMVDIASVDIGVERAQDLRMLGRFFLSLSVVLSLGSVTTDGTSSRRGSEKASWNPPERKELLWDAQDFSGREAPRAWERWLWCRVYDWDLIGFKQLAAAGRIDLLQFMERHGACGAQGVEVELFASSEDDGGSDSEASPTSHPTSFGTFNPEDRPTGSGVAGDVHRLGKAPAHHHRHDRDAVIPAAEAHRAVRVSQRLRLAKSPRKVCQPRGLTQLPALHAAQDFLRPPSLLDRGSSPARLKASAAARLEASHLGERLRASHQAVMASQIIIDRMEAKLMVADAWQASQDRSRPREPASRPPRPSCAQLASSSECADASMRLTRTNGPQKDGTL